MATELAEISCVAEISYVGGISTRKRKQKGKGELILIIADFKCIKLLMVLKTGPVLVHDLTTAYSVCIPDRFALNTNFGCLHTNNTSLLYSKFVSENRLY